MACASCREEGQQRPRAPKIPGGRGVRNRRSSQRNQTGKDVLNDTQKLLATAHVAGENESLARVAKALRTSLRRCSFARGSNPKRFHVAAMSVSAAFLYSNRGSSSRAADFEPSSESFIALPLSVSRCSREGVSQRESVHCPRGGSRPRSSRLKANANVRPGPPIVPARPHAIFTLCSSAIVKQRLTQGFAEGPRADSVAPTAGVRSAQAPLDQRPGVLAMIAPGFASEVQCFVCC